jgi:hypothetical protein
MYAARGNSAHNKAGRDQGVLDQVLAVVVAVKSLEDVNHEIIPFPALQE